MLLPGAALAQTHMQFPSSSPPVEPVPGPAPGGTPPIATFNQTIQSPPANWDPYATPGSQPSTLVPQDPYFPGGMSGPPGPSIATMQRLIDEYRLDYVWMPGNSSNEFGINDADASVTFAVPFLYNSQEPLLVTPGFAIHAWNGPHSTGLDSAEMPGQAFDAYLQGAWNPTVTDWLSGELSMRVGVYSDFEKITGQAIRYTGRGAAVLKFSPSFNIKAGVWYLDRVRVKLLPIGGVVWEPNPDWRFDIVFPEPKIARRLSNYGNTQWWMYVRGEYGGGSWEITRYNVDLNGNMLDDDGPILDQVDYNDMRVAFGFEFLNDCSISGLFEVGLAFERELYYRRTPPKQFDLNSTVFVRGGLTY